MATLNEERPNLHDANFNVTLLENTTGHKRFSPFVRQMFATAGSILCAVSAGTVVGYSAILLPQLEQDNHFNFTVEEQSWIASGATLPMAPICILGGVLMEIFGRKICNITVNIPFLIGWVLLYFSSDLLMFLLGRILQGISLGMSGPLNSIFIAETTDPKYRGVLLSTVSLGYTLGILLCHAAGTFYTWKITALLCGVINVISFLIFIVVPESPSFYIAKRQFEKAYKAYGWLRGYGSEAISEFNSMIVSQSLKKKCNTSYMVLKKMCEPEFYRAFFILFGMFFLLQFIGFNTVAFYTVSIMKDVMGDSFDEYLAMILADVMRLVVGVLSCCIIKTCRRRPLFLFSGLGTGVSMTALAVFMYVSHLLPEGGSLAFIPIVLMTSYICFSTLGLLPLPWCLIGELFPLNSRGLGSGLASAANFLFFFFVVKTAPSLFSIIEVEGTFLIYGLIGTIGTPLLYVLLPETKNKTLQEIEDDMSKQTSPKNKAKKSESS